MPGSRETLRVFIVDDESVIATTLSMVLRQNGLDAYCFELPLEALRASREMPPDLLITDVMMPLLSGIDLAIQMQEHSPTCRVLLFSGHPSTSELLELARKDGHEFTILAKPVHPTELFNQIHSVMNS